MEAVQPDSSAAGTSKLTSSVVWRTILVKGGNLINVQVKVVREHVIYVVVVPRRNLKDGKKTFHVLKGALLIRNTELDADGHEFYMVFNEGIYDAIRSQGTHVPDGMEAEVVVVTAHRSSIEWAIRSGLTLTVANSTPEQFAARDTAVANVAASLGHCRDPDKVDAQRAAGRGASHTDSRGQTNLVAKEGFLWSANRSLDTRVGTSRRISPRISARNWALIELADKVWRVKGEYETVVLEAIAIVKNERALSASRVSSLSARLVRSAERMRTLSIAPYGRRGFPRIADDLDQAVKALRERRFADARSLLDGCRRAFKMMDGRRAIEEICTVASRVAKAGIVPSAASISNFDADIDAAEAMLYEDGKPLDHGFKNPVIENKVVPELRAAKAAAHTLLGYMALEVHERIDAARLPL